MRNIKSLHQIIIVSAIVLLVNIIGLNDFSNWVANTFINTLLLILIFRVSDSNIELPNITKYLYKTRTDSDFVNKFDNKFLYFIIAVIVGFFIPDGLGFVEKVVKIIFSTSIIFITINTFRLFVDNIILNRKKQTTGYIRAIIVTIYFRFVIGILFTESNSLFDGNGFFEFIDIFLFAVILIMSFISSGNNNWIHYLTRKDKNRFFWSLIFFNSFLVLFIVSLLDDEGVFYNMLNSTVQGSPVIVINSMCFLLVSGIRFGITCFFSFSSAEVVEKKQTELSTLTYINS
ncbi:hypothetical protein OAQ99_07905, partial [Candidatus Kapabacteria bacterium]|nr:hypothetical protein [Candidatus Kapabacteria bacterium]